MSPAVIICSQIRLGIIFWTGNHTWKGYFNKWIVLQAFAITSTMYSQIRMLAIAWGLAPNRRFGIGRTGETNERISAEW